MSKPKAVPENHTVYILLDEGENAVRVVSIRNAGDVKVNVDEELAPTIIEMVDGTGIEFQDIRVYEVVRAYSVKPRFELEKVEQK